MYAGARETVASRVLYSTVVACQPVVAVVSARAEWAQHLSVGLILFGRAAVAAALRWRQRARVCAGEARPSCCAAQGRRPRPAARSPARPARPGSRRSFRAGPL